MERYGVECEKLTPHEYYAVRQDVDLVAAIRNGSGASVTWRSPFQTKIPRNNTAPVDFFSCAARKNAPTVFILHPLMSPTHIPHTPMASRVNQLAPHPHTLPFH